MKYGYGVLQRAKAMGACEQSGRGCCGSARALVAGVEGPREAQRRAGLSLRRFSAEDNASKACLHPRWERHRVHAALPLFLVKDFVNVEGEAGSLQEASEAEAAAKASLISEIYGEELKAHGLGRYARSERSATQGRWTQLRRRRLMCLGGLDRRAEPFLPPKFVPVQVCLIQTGPFVKTFPKPSSNLDQTSSGWVPRKVSGRRRQCASGNADV